MESVFFKCLIYSLKKKKFIINLCLIFWSYFIFLFEKTNWNAGPICFFRDPIFVNPKDEELKLEEEEKTRPSSRVSDRRNQPWIRVRDLSHVTLTST